MYSCNLSTAETGDLLASQPAEAAISHVSKSRVRGGKVTRWVKVLTAQPDDLSLTHIKSQMRCHTHICGLNTPKVKRKVEISLKAKDGLAWSIQHGRNS